MTFMPNSTIYLCKVDIDSSYKNQIYFDTLAEQTTYFKNKSVDLLISYLTVRKTLPNGQLQSSIKIDMNIDKVQSLGVNYLMYQNAHHGEKWFYAFVDKLIYISEGVTELVFTTDVYQTWLFDVRVLPSYVVREHSATDELGEHIIPEKFNCNDFNYMKLLPETEITGSDLLDDYCFMMCSSECADSYTSEGEFSGYSIEDIPQGLFFYVCMNYNEINKVNNALSDKDEGWLQCITAIPKFALKNAYICGHNSEIKKPDDETVIGGMITTLGGTDEIKSRMAQEYVNITFDKSTVKLNGYTPKNNKLYTAPYCALCVSNQIGTMNTYAIEDFKQVNVPEDIREIQFVLTADISPAPSIYLVPCNYQGISTNFNYASTISELPQISHNSDSYKLWLAKNQGTLALETVGNIANIVTGVATAGTGVGAMQAMHGVTGVIDTINTVNQAERMPNKITGGGGRNNLALMAKQIKFNYYWKTIKRDYAETIDNYFTMYGYQTNKVKQPNTNVRPYFNYIQTIDVNIVGGIPFDDMERLKAVYNNGVTLWKKAAVIGNYDVDNSPQ